MDQRKDEHWETRPDHYFDALGLWEAIERSQGLIDIPGSAEVAQAMQDQLSRLVGESVRRKRHVHEAE